MVVETAQPTRLVELRRSESIGAMVDLARHPLEAVARLRARYGGFVRLRGGRQPIYVVSEPALVREVMQVQARSFGRGSNAAPVRMLIGDGLVMLDGERWWRERRLMQPAFHRQRIAEYAGILIDEAREWLDRNIPAGQQVDLLPAMMQLAGRLTMRVLFSGNTPPSSMVEAIRAALAHIDWEMSLLPRPPLWVPTPRRARFRRQVAELRAGIGALIAQRRADPNPPDDLITALMTSEDDNGVVLSEGELLDEVLTIFLAGQETTATALTCGLWLLDRHPETRAELRAEIEAVGGEITPETVGNLPLLRNVIYETLRLYPPVWALGRTAREEVEMAGAKLPAGATVLMSPYQLHHAPDLWDEPEAFRPERFREGVPRHDGRYMPFGLGQRICIGEHLAMMEMCAVFGLLVSRPGRLQVEGDLPLRAGVSLGPDGPVPARWVV